MILQLFFVHVHSKKLLCKIETPFRKTNFGKIHDKMNVKSKYSAKKMFFFTQEMYGSERQDEK